MLSWPKNGRNGAARIRPGRGRLLLLNGHEQRSIVRDIGGERRRQNGNDEIHFAVLVLGDVQRRHLGGASNFGSQHDTRGFR